MSKHGKGGKDGGQRKKIKLSMNAVSYLSLLLFNTTKGEEGEASAPDEKIEFYFRDGENCFCCSS